MIRLKKGRQQKKKLREHAGNLIENKRFGGERERGGCFTIKRMFIKIKQIGQRSGDMIMKSRGI